VAIGLSAGFIEPLEASALAIVEMSAAMVSDDLPATRAAMDIVARRFNDAFLPLGTRDRLPQAALRAEPAARHPYWRDNTDPAKVPERLAELLTLWRTSRRRARFRRIEEVFPSASYQYILYGMGFRSDFSRAAAAGSRMADRYFPKRQPYPQDAGRAARNRALINHIKRHGLQKI
jgi:phytoene dehydrogenase-like protein